MTRSRQLRLVVLLGVLAVMTIWQFRQARRQTPVQPPNAASSSGDITDEQARAFLALEAREKEAEKTVWGPELDAQRHEDVFLQLWDGLNQSADPIAALGAVVFEELRWPSLESTRELPHDIREIRFANGSDQDQNRRRVLSAEAWRSLLAGWRAEGWQIGRTRWALIHFSPAAGGRPAASTVAFSAQIFNRNQGLRASSAGELEIEWQPASPGGGAPEPRAVAVKDLRWLQRLGPPLFGEWAQIELPLPRGVVFGDPMLLHDLDGDGLSEILMMGARRLVCRGGQGFQAEELSQIQPRRVWAAALLDLTGDGRADLLCADEEGLLLLEHDGASGFRGPGKRAWKSLGKINHPRVMAAGDADGDGDLDIWLAQYKLPYQGGQFPTPYFDANDGFPSFLLRNLGKDGFSDITEASGLDC